MGEPNAEPRLRVAIVGGGICGLALCVYLHKLARVSVTLYEGASKFSEIGAGIMMGWNALKVFKEMGLYDEYAKLAMASWSDPSHASDAFFQFRFGDGRDDGEPFFSMTMPGGQMNSHRADLLELLIAHVPKESVRFRKHLRDYAQRTSGEVVMTFADGTSADADVLIAADGIKSTVRRLMYENRGEADEQEPLWSGTVAYRALIPTHKVMAAMGKTITTTPIMWLEKSRHVVHYPVAGGNAINFVGMVSDYSRGRHPKWEKPEWVEHDVDERELLRDFAGCGEQVSAILKLVEKPSRWALFDLPDLPSFVQGNVALVGDAAHAMTPHQGNGASQGIEDVHVLAHILSQPNVTASNVSLALQAYELVRKKRVQRVKELSYETGRLWELSTPAGDDTKEFERVAVERFGWIWGVDLAEQLERAVHWFEKSMA